MMMILVVDEVIVMMVVIVMRSFFLSWYNIVNDDDNVWVASKYVCVNVFIHVCMKDSDDNVCLHGCVHYQL